MLSCTDYFRRRSSHLDDVDEDEHDLSWGNSVYNVKFDERTHYSNFGHRYWFYLQDAVDNVPEYLVHWDPFVKYVVTSAPACQLSDEISLSSLSFFLLSASFSPLLLDIRLAAEYGLLPIYKEPFGEVFQESEKKEFKQLLIHMKVMNEEGESNMTEDQWDAASESLLPYSHFPVLTFLPMQTSTSPSRSRSASTPISYLYPYSYCSST